MRVRHLKLRGHLDISQNEIENLIENDVSKVNCFRLHCNCSVNQNHSTYHLADSFHVDDAIMKAYEATMDLTLIDKAFTKQTDKIVYLYAREVTTTGIDKDQLKRVLANSIDYIGEGT